MVTLKETKRENVALKSSMPLSTFFLIMNLIRTRYPSTFFYTSLRIGSHWSCTCIPAILSVSYQVQMLCCTSRTCQRHGALLGLDAAF